MKIELKKLALFPRMAEETTAFAADVYVDGVLVGHAKNDGQGGMSLVSWKVPHARRVEIEDALKDRVPAEYASFTSGVEWAIDELVEAERSKKEIAKQDASLKRSCAKRGTGALRFDVPSDHTTNTIWIEFRLGNEDAVKADMLKKHPAATNWTVIVQPTGPRPR